MKKILVAILVLCFAGQMEVFAQKKFGHIDAAALVESMPEKKKAQTDMETYAKGLQEQLRIMSAEFDKKYQDYVAQEASMTDLVKQTKAKELEDLQNRIKDFQTKAQDDIAKKEQELMAPIIDKAKKAIEAVAKEKGINYVIDSSAGLLLVKDETDDILPAVKKHLNIQ
jgi:outer membrane protein